MAKNLVIVESPAKAKSINKILGSDFQVVASLGHVRDLPQGKLGVDVEKGFKPHYTTIKSRQKVLTELKKAAAKAEAVYLAPDPDREGEAIAWHLFEALKGKVDPDHFFRVTYNEITPPAIRQAFAEPGRVDMNRVNSQQARRILDRLVGYRVSPLLWRQVKGGSSAGRVQSVALRLVCEREDAIDAFEPEEYWLVGVQARKQEEPLTPFAMRLVSVDGEKADIKESAQAEKIQHDLETRGLVVSSVKELEKKRRPKPPFITSTLQQTASSLLGFTPARTMRVAQSLYEGVDFGEGPTGLITYMRTDSVHLAGQAVETCRHYVDQTFGAPYLPEKPAFYRSRSGAQEAHEAIRPTDVNRTPESLERILEPAQLKLYRIIWQRFVACQMNPARLLQRTAEAEARPQGASAAAGPAYVFRATTTDVLFDGFMKVTGRDKPKSDDGNGDNGDEAPEGLPPLNEEEPLDVLGCETEQKFTQPPKRFTEASLVRAMEENGVGRPSTYASILSVLYDREYILKEKRALHPTTVGREVNRFLVEHLDHLFNARFTASMEESLDDVEEGRKEWTEMLEAFNRDFEQWLEKARGPEADAEQLAEILKLLGEVKEWAPPVKRGRRTYSDQSFFERMCKQVEEGKKKVTQRQLDALKQMACRYEAQIPGLEERVGDLGLEEMLAEARKPKEPPRETTTEKLQLLETITFDEPRKVGKRTYDDGKFAGSLGDQVASGKRLSENQLKHLDRLVLKYAEQIPDFEALAEKLDIKAQPEVEDTVSGPLLDLMGQVSEWKEPTKRGKRTWDDKGFFESLRNQFRTKKTLSERQVASLKKLMARYAGQIPGYEEKREELGLPEPKKPKAKE